MSCEAGKRIEGSREVLSLVELERIYIGGKRTRRHPSSPQCTINPDSLHSNIQQQDKSIHIAARQAVPKKQHDSAY
jgi:hypothetical protein